MQGTQSQFLSQDGYKGEDRPGEMFLTGRQPSYQDDGGCSGGGEGQATTEPGEGQAKTGEVASLVRTAEIESHNKR